MFDFDWLPPPLSTFAQKLAAKLKAKFEYEAIPIGLAILTIILSVIGWSEKSFDRSFKSIAFIALSSLSAFSPNVKNLDGGNDLTYAAALCGALTLYSSAAVIAANVLRESRRKLVARFSRRHVLIIGATKLAERAEKIWRRRTTGPLQIMPTSAERPTWASQYVRHELDETLVRGFAVARARHVFLDLGEDSRTLTLAYKMLATMATTEPVLHDDDEREWVIIGRDIDMADHFIAKVRELKSPDGAKAKLPRLHFLDPDRLEARHLLIDKPLFLAAAALAQRCIHVLVIGFAPVAWHLIEMTYLTGLTVDLGAPIVTILTPQPDVHRRRFFSGRAALGDTIDVAFLDFDALDDFQTGETEPGRLMRERDEKAPVTTIISVLEETDQNIAVAMRIDAIHRKTGRLGCPIFTRDDEGDEAFLSSGGRFDQVIGGFSTFGLTDSFLEIELCDADKRDVLARALHDRYLETTQAVGRAPAGWNDLSETLHRANRNAAAHWLAKMHLFGFDVADRPPCVLPKLGDDDANRLLAAANGDPASPDAETFLRAARCEHERWMIERRLDGWTFGALRDDHAQIHPLLVPWDTLVERHPDEVTKDKEQVKALIHCLRDSGDPDVPLKRRVEATGALPA